VCYSSQQEHPERSATTYLQHADIAKFATLPVLFHSSYINFLQKFKGVEKTSEATKLPYLDVIWDLDFDSMHGVFLNVVLHLMTFWFSDQYQTQLFSLHKHSQSVQNMLQSIKLPHDFPKFPPLSTFASWKAAELRYELISHYEFLTILHGFNIH
jgi:hypothetical protein